MPAGMKETSKETSSVPAPVYLDFTTRTVCRGGCGGTKRWTAGGDVRRSGPHELRWGGAVARALRDHPGCGAQIMRV